MALENYKELIDDCKKYVELRYNVLRLELLEKLSKIVALVLLVVIGVCLVLAALVYFSLALAAWLKPMVGIVAALCIIGGIYLLILLIVIALRKQIFVNPLVKQLCKIIFSESNSDENESK